jgi:hypothetical protein
MIFRIPGYDYEYYFNSEVVDTCIEKLRGEMTKMYLCVIVFDSYTHDNKPDYLEKSIKISRENILRTSAPWVKIIESQIVVIEKDNKYIVMKNFYGERDVEVFVV